jgi:hypothetical protein
MGQVPVQAPALGVLLEPATQPRPLAQQRLVRDLRLAFAERDQAVAREHREDPGAVQLGDGHALAHVALARETQQDPSRLLALVRSEALVRRLGQPRDRAAHAARPVVRLEVQLPAVALLPQLQQRGRQQRQPAGLALDVRDQRVDEVRLDVQAGAEGGQLDRAAQLVPAHRRRALALVATRRERLLELVHGDHRAIVRSERGGRVLERLQRMLAGAEQRDRPAGAAGQHAVGERGEQSGAHGRRLAAPRRADHAHQARARQPRHHVGHEPLAAEEDGGVAGLERGQPLERACRNARLRDRGVGALAQALELDDAGHEVVLGQMPPGAFGRRAGRGVPESPQRLFPCPLGGRLVHARRDPAAVRDQPVDRHVAVIAADVARELQREARPAHASSCSRPPKLLMNSDVGEDNGGTIVALASGGDAICRALNNNQRLDVADARAFLGRYLQLP